MNTKLTNEEIVEKYVRFIARDEFAKLMAEKSKPAKSVYLIQGVDGGPVKIGVARDPDKRLAELQRTSPVKLTILRTLDGGVQLERELHQRFADLRLHGEWFEPLVLDLVGQS